MQNALKRDERVELRDIFSIETRIQKAQEEAEEMHATVASIGSPVYTVYDDEDAEKLASDLS